MEDMNTAALGRVSRLVGDDLMRHIGTIRVILFGVGGVGSWCAEALVRSGVRHLTLVDPDCVIATNINRQLMATPATVGRPKVDALRERLLQIAPDAQIVPMRKRFTEENREEFRLQEYDYILDAIDALKDKAALILYGTRQEGVFFSSMGAACKVDPSQVREAEFWNVRGCPLGAAIRKKYKQNGWYPGRKFRCVYGEEVLENRGEEPAMEEPADADLPKKAVTNGSLCHITGIFGFTLAGFVLRDLYRKEAWK